MTKNLIILLFTIGIYNPNILGQNLVSNGGFENGTYNGGVDPISYYSGVHEESWWNDLWNSSTHHRFDADVDNWYVAEASKIYGGKRRDSPDWMDPDFYYHQEMDGNCTNTRYIRCAFPNESIMVELKKGYKLKKVILTNFKLNMTFQ